VSSERRLGGERARVDGFFGIATLSGDSTRLIGQLRVTLHGEMVARLDDLAWSAPSTSSTNVFPATPSSVRFVVLSFSVPFASNENTRLSALACTFSVIAKPSSAITAPPLAPKLSGRRGS